MNLPAPPEEGQVLIGPQFSEPMRVVTAAGNGLSSNLCLVGTRRGPFYLRRTKEAMVHFPQRDANGEWGVRPIFTRAIPTCQVTAEPSDHPVYVEQKGQPAAFWLRVGNATRSLPIDEAVRHIQTRWSGK